ncbi:glycosyltransferase family 4 protein [Streptomyces cavernae]|uniref:glycosyltransferase family 4 protein n=1 Tax=Streptomyces cavernae TaxID=2259034 RepID=UPI000FEBFA96|nr:glycosyltransferase family 4 protein [Streptomyces cavernae]
MKITFLLHNAYGIGGTIRSTMNLTSALAERHEVEIVSLVRTRDTPSLSVSSKVRMSSLIDLRKDSPAYEGDHPLAAYESAVAPPTEIKSGGYSRLTDARLADFLHATDSDAVIATRPTLVVGLAEYGQDRYVRIGQEHLTYDSHAVDVRAAQDAAIGRLDAFVTVSDADAAIHRTRLPGLTTKILGIPNACPTPRTAPARGEAKLVVAAGRLIPIKRWDLLVQAFAKVVAERPDWRLRIYGRGREADTLRAAIDELALNNHVFLMGAHSPIETEWAKGAIAAVTSDSESFGMTIVEAMHAGLPVVATDCPHGPGEIITNGEDGLLVPVGDIDGIAEGLLALINDEPRRRAMGERARVAAGRYAPTLIAERYVDLIGELRAAHVSLAGGTTSATTTSTRPATVKPGTVKPGTAASGTSLSQTTVSGTSARISGARHPAPLRRLAGRVLRPLRRAGSVTAARTVAAKASTAVARSARVKPDSKPGALKSLRPKGGCRIDTDGDIVVRIAPAGVSGTRLTLTVGRRRGKERIRIPLQAPTEPGEPWTAVIERGAHTMPEGRWDLHVERAADGARHRVVADLVEQQGLLTVAPAPREPLAWRIPYTTADGFLAVRAWHRPLHAETTAVHVNDEHLTVEGTLYGADWPDELTLVAVSGRGRIPVPVHRTGTAGFHATVSFTALAEAHSSDCVWDLVLPSGKTEVRVGRLLGDIVERQKTDTYPTTEYAPDAPELPGPLRIRPYFTGTNDLVIGVRSAK